MEDSSNVAGANENDQPPDMSSPDPNTEEGAAEGGGFIDDAVEGGSAASDSDSDDDDEGQYEDLDEEDLDLINENRAAFDEPPVREQTGFRRLKQASGMDDEDEVGVGAAAPARSAREYFDDDQQDYGEGGYEYGEDDGAGSYDDEGGMEEGFGEGFQAAQLREVFGPQYQMVFHICAGAKPSDVGRTDGLYDDPEAYGDDGGEAGGEDAVGVVEKSPEELVVEADEPERLQARFANRPRPVPVTALKAEAAWLRVKLKDFCDSISIPDLPGVEPDGPQDIQMTVLNPFEFPLTSIFDDAKQRSRYDKVFQRSGFPAEGAPTTGMSGCVFFPPSKSIEEDVEEKIVAVLGFLLNDRLDVPFITHHNGNEIFPPLTHEVVWLVYDWDLQYWRQEEARKLALHESKKFAALGGDGALSYEVRNLIEQTSDENVINDCLTYMTHKFNQENGDEQSGSNATNQATGERRPKRRKTAAPVESLYHKYFTTTGLRSRWARYIVPLEHWIEALKQMQYGTWIKGEETDEMQLGDEGNETTGTVTAPDPPPAVVASHDEDSVHVWLKSLVQPTETDLEPLLMSGRFYDVVVRCEGSKIGSHPVIRNIVRQWFFGVASVSTVTTTKGERYLDPCQVDYIPCRLYKRPLKHFTSKHESRQPRSEELESVSKARTRYDWWATVLDLVSSCNRHREYGLEISRACDQDLANLLVHPLANDDQTPWKQTTDLDAERWKRAKKNLTARKQKELGGSASARLPSADIYEQEYSQWLQSDEEDHAQIQFFVKELLATFAPATAPEGWRKFLADILTAGITRNILPDLRKEIKNLIVRQSVEYVGYMCQQQLLLRLGIAPVDNFLVACPPKQKRLGQFPDFHSLSYDDDDDDADDVVPESEAQNFAQPVIENDSYAPNSVTLRPHPTVCGLTIEKRFPDTESVVHMTVTDRNGIVTETFSFGLLFEHIFYDPNSDDPRARTPLRENVKREAKHFESILLSRNTRPNVVAVTANCLLAVDLFNYVDHLSRKRIKFRKFSFTVQWVNPEVPKLIAQSSQSLRSLKGCANSYQTEALSSCRFLQEPLAETLNLWGFGSDDVAPSVSTNPVLGLRLHRLQSFLPPSALQEWLLAVAVRVVNAVGVPINRLRTVKCLRSLLPFVSGFGPKKANAFMSTFIWPIGSRDSLKGAECGSSTIGELVWLNMASFVKLSKDVDLDERSPALDFSRIHPQTESRYAHKMCQAAQEEDAEASNFLAASFQHPEALEDLDLEAYAYIITVDQSTRMLPLLEFIKREVNAPYADARITVEQESKERLFMLLSGDDPLSLRPGCLITVQMDNERRRTFTVMSSQMPAEVRDIDEYERQEERRISKDSVIRARIESYDYDNCGLVCLATRRGMKNLIEKHSGIHDVNQHILSLLTREDFDSAVELRRKLLFISDSERTSSGRKGPERPSRILHPAFRALPQQKLFHHIRASREVGACYFRISETTKTLVLCLQTMTSPCRIKGIAIQETLPYTDVGVGSELRIGNQSFTTLDELVANFCTPLTSFVKEVAENPKFYSGLNAEGLEKHLTEEIEKKGRENGMLLWGMCVDETYPADRPDERFIIVVASMSERSRTTQAVRDSLYVTNRGFQIWTHRDLSLKKILTWYKNEGFMQRAHYRQRFAEERKRMSRN